MAENLKWPDTLSIDAHIEGRKAVRGGLHPDAKKWPFRDQPTQVRTFLKPPPEADPNNWTDLRVGWGLILPDRPELSEADRIAAVDAPEPIRRLLEARAPAPVLRYLGGTTNRLRFLRNYRDGKDIAISGAPPGRAPGSLPRYLLIYGPPSEIPWDLQYLLNAVAAVGRLDLSGDALKNYVDALIANWQGAPARQDHAVVWAVDHGDDDISHLMRNAIAQPIYNELKGDNQIGPKAQFLDGTTDASRATADALRLALEGQRPGLIVTTSHGRTDPLDDPAAMAAQLGLPVDQASQTLQVGALLGGGWTPHGAIWYAHACCSAGSDSRTLFQGLLEPGSDVDLVLKAVASLGARTAPLPNSLLGHAAPLRAFIGHVEPTFDWTLREKNGQYLTDSVVRSFYNRLYKPMTLGWAMRDVFDRLGGLFEGYDTNLRAFDGGDATRSAMLYFLLAARDVQSLVILGDPTAILPSL